MFDNAKGETTCGCTERSRQYGEYVAYVTVSFELIE
jgi:hypothetical protein